MTSLTSWRASVYYEHTPIEYWQLQEAKAHFSEVIKLAVTVGPQGISVRGHHQAVIISLNEYEKLVGNKQNFFNFMQQSPLKGLELDIMRDKSKNRDVEL